MSVFGATDSPLSASPRLGFIPIPNMTVSNLVASTGSGEITLTTAQLLGGFINVDCQDAQNALLPTAEDLIAYVPGASGSSQITGACGFRTLIKNTGDSTLTIVTNTGATLTGTTVTVLTAELKEFVFVITNSQRGSAAYTCYTGLHSTF